MSTTFRQQLAKVMLIVCVREECKTIAQAYAATKEKSNPESDYWHHPHFVTPLKKFVQWFNTNHPGNDPDITISQMREILDEVFSEESEESE
jgi:hypothetical protein